jgi:hypothetical protein
LLATRLISRVRDRLGVEVPLADFFGKPAISAVAGLVEARQAGDVVPAINLIPRVGRVPDGPTG